RDLIVTGVQTCLFRSQFYRLLKGTERIRILTRQIHLQWNVLFRLLRVSLTGILQFAIAHTSWIGLVRIVSTFGAAALAGYTIARSEERRVGKEAEARA